MREAPACTAPVGEPQATVAGQAPGDASPIMDPHNNSADRLRDEQNRKKEIDFTRTDAVKVKGNSPIVFKSAAIFYLGRPIFGEFCGFGPGSFEMVSLVVPTCESESKHFESEPDSERSIDHGCCRYWAEGPDRVQGSHGQPWVAPLPHVWNERGKIPANAVVPHNICCLHSQNRHRRSRCRQPWRSLVWPQRVNKAYTTTRGPYHACCRRINSHLLHVGY